MLKVLVVYAVDEEKIDLSMANCHFDFCKTGVGKVNAAIAVQKSIADVNPDLVINIGTAGSVDHPIGTIHLCNVFVDRDMHKLKEFGVSFHEDFSNETKAISLFDDWQFDSICNTGDSFLTQIEGHGDVYDMESFAVARVCRQYQLPFVAVKYVTDIIGQNSVQHWEEKLAEAQLALQNFMDIRPFKVSNQHVSENINQLIDKYRLKPHPEGGWYNEVYRSNLNIHCNHVYGNKQRVALTSIYYLLSDKQNSTFHKLKSPETWYFHKGMPLVIQVITLAGELKKIELSDSPDGVLQLTIEPDCWFAAGLKNQAGYTLVSCAVAPGFEFEDFVIGNRDYLMDIYPQHRDVIWLFTR